MRALRLAFFAIIFLLASLSEQKPSLVEEIERLNQLTPIKPLDNFIMFWRPQKVGSSTMLSVLLSYGFRYNLLPRTRGHSTSFCLKILSCAYDNPYTTLSSDERSYLTKHLHRYRQETMASKRYHLIESMSYYMSVYHELCNQRHDIISQNLRCAFKARYPSFFNFNDTSYPVHEIFMVREPLSRLISSYYFWGEIAKMRKYRSKKGSEEKQNDRPGLLRLGNLDHSSMNVVLARGSYVYHGNESSVPSMDLAMKFAQAFPLNRGMPGPSFTYSAFSDNPRDAGEVILSNRMMTMITERLDESLVVLSHYLNWSLADVVITMHRKSLSTHPKAKDWPELAANVMKRNLEESGEYDVYKKANEALDSRIADLKRNGVNFEEELNLLRQLRSRSSTLCLSENMLAKYKEHLQKAGVSKHSTTNKLREVEDKYVHGGHVFSWNGEFLYSYDVCGGCEAHAMLYALRHGLADSVDAAPTLEQLPSSHRLGNADFANCP